jgi:pantoate kinase
MATEMVTKPIAVAKAFCPGHITGFFGIPRDTIAATTTTTSSSLTLLHKGSIGAGFSIDRGTTTSAYIYESAIKGYEIQINGIKTHTAEVSKWIIEQYVNLTDRPYFVSVSHEVEIPIGFGLGSSGAAALSLSYALNQALGAGLSKIQAAQIAHCAEIACKTGLGTVIAEFVGGFEMRMSPGAPGIGSIKSIPQDDRRKAVVLCLAPILTKSFLTDRINEVDGLGTVMLNKLSRSRTIDDFLKMSQEFADRLYLTKGRCKRPIEALRAKGFESSVALFGETLFTLVDDSRVKEATNVLKEFGGRLLVCNIDNAGARVL